ncbi:MAG: peptide ABC transporter substrate-binding protein [Thermomicrobiales bacterium]|nr:peptide ABC transporter substrate-binding protein [Thermomicrobiales bacterium]
MSRDELDQDVSQTDGLLARRADRRKVLGAAAGIAGASLLGGEVSAAPNRPGSLSRTLAQELPADAAPAEAQVYVVPDNVTIAKVLDFYEAVYERPSDGASDLFSEPLVRMNKNFEILPGSAESWSSDETGTIWTFKLRQGLTWSDGNPVTASDWVATFQYGASPEHAWDFTWFFQGVIKNWSAVVAPAEGTEALTPDQIGVRVGADESELVIETEVPAPYLPAMMLYSNPLSKAGLTNVGPLYNTNPETAISAGPYILSEWQKDQQIVYVRNDKYTGPMKVNVNKVVIKLASIDTYFTMYQNNEIDYMQAPPPAALTLMQSDEETAKEVYSGVGDFPTWYIFFDVTKAPFDNLKVRQAWSHAIDRDLLKQQVLGPNGTQAYSWLAPGFPASQREEMSSIQNFDPELAKSLLAEAGYPDGEGFPQQELWLRAPSPLDKTVAAALASMLKENLNIDVSLLEKDSQGFTAALNAKPTEIPLGYVRYGMDYLDPSNMLSVWRSGGRHSWSNPEFDAKLKEASEFLGDPAERTAMFQEAERILVSDVPGVFIYHGTPVQFIKPWLKGDFLTADANGITSLHWPGFTTMSTVPEVLYIGAEAPDRA